MFLQGWTDLVELAVRDSTSRAHTLAIREGVDTAHWATPDTAAGALRLICRRLGGEARMTPDVYRRERRRLLDAAGRGRDELADLLPNENQITRIFGDWPAALAGAGLPALDRSPSPPRPAPSIVEILDRCYSHHQTQPTLGELELFAQANGIPFPRRQGAYAEYVAVWKAERIDRGLLAPDLPPPKRDRPDYGVDIGAALPGERRGVRRWTREMLEPWVDRFLDELPAGARPTQRAWRDWCHDLEGAPDASRLAQIGGLIGAIDAGNRRRRERHSQPQANISEAR
jgi:hypothetical protein